MDTAALGVVLVAALGAIGLLTYYLTIGTGAAKAGGMSNPMNSISSIATTDATTA